MKSFNNSKPRVLFLGTADFAIPSLEALIRDDRISVVGVVTQPDKPFGRKQELRATPVKQLLESQYSELAIKIFTPQKLSITATEILDELEPDLIITAAYGQIVPDEMLEYPSLEAWNIHGSILPALRGAVPVQMSILHGFKTTGVTIQKMASEMDTGAILAISQTEITENDTTETLMQKLAEIGAELLIENIDEIISKQYELTEQNESDATFCYQKDIAKDNAKISETTDDDLALRMIRAFDPWPIAWLEIDTGSHAGKRLKVYKAAKFSAIEKGYGLEWSDDGLLLNLKGGQLLLLDIQLEGKDRRASSNYKFIVE